MNGFRFSRVAVVVALMAAISVGCASSRGRGCRSGGCRVSSAGSVPPRRTETASSSHDHEKVQQTCPVTGEPLGSMGPAIPVTVKGQTIQVCCDGCVAAVKKNPEKYLKIVDAELARSDSSDREAAFYDRPAAAAGRSFRSSDGHQHQH